MDVIERRSVLALAMVYLFRMLGLFLIMPVISVAADGLDGADAALIGAAIGIYGFTQATLQIPMGMMSDKVGRKRVIIFGLVLFALGSVICANADSIMSLIFGRAIQGAGAIASTLMALLSDVTKEQNRTKAMASVGISIGASFMLSLILGPVLFEWLGLSGLFYLSFAFSIIGMALIIWVVPNQTQHAFRRDTTPSLTALGGVLKDARLRFLNISILLLHASLTALFVAIPSLLIHRYGLSLGKHSILYLLVMGGAFILMLPLIIAAEGKGKMKQVLTLVIAIIGLTTILMEWSSQLWLFAVAVCLFFVAFNTLEATLPSVISKLAPVGYRGTAMGVFSTHQFMGAFIGGAGGGWLLQHTSVAMLFTVIGCVWLAWALVSAMQPAPQPVSSMAFSVAAHSAQDVQQLTQQLMEIQGVEDVQIFTDEQTAYLKVNKKQLDKEALQRIAPQVK
ncbi:Inner membrane transport protein YajR [Marinomonas aquimarina]|uniref:Inner membrane transport protein YajR n=1 Tax=Marinomonas aquimarina TaxID=295068 RepID=A0A1A8TCT2_9GAMM|nr:MFS transporter [Marinomonas aquimarina]SBS29478.1 Inner membrane transport protein YajR [Marinomonas aquimarina]